MTCLTDEHFEGYIRAAATDMKPGAERLIHKDAIKCFTNTHRGNGRLRVIHNSNVQILADTRGGVDIVDVLLW